MLESRIDELVLTKGWTTIRAEELRLWYEQKVTKGVWRDIQNRVDTLSEETENPKLKVGVYDYDGNFLLVDLSEIGTLSDLAK
ncbi:hypothetical protein GC1_17310 [Leisingera sp. ANG1]|nr:hypothetical protein [Leisingera sp. ANG-S]KIC23908.1 hypothetical protein RA23_12825 [Leisingera sp. ANG-S3]KIC50533.1 hypothetical protein RA22_19870 [Leisingera sp. ANG-S]KID07776.1 hypothetical protein GC1_17310 [Leisingera sp. ANG1]